VLAVVVAVGVSAVVRILRVLAVAWGCWGKAQTALAVQAQDQTPPAV
jgi:hypothetical protein